MDLSLDIEANTSISGCLRNFSATETLGGSEKFYCDSCCSLQEAQKCMKIKALPKVLALHLKRFKYIESAGRYKKLCHRVVFPQVRVCVCCARSSTLPRNSIIILPHPATSHLLKCHVPCTAAHTVRF